MMTGDGGSLPTFSVPLPYLRPVPSSREEGARDLGRAETPVNTSSSLEAELLWQAAGDPSILTNTLGRWHCRGDSNPWLPRLLLPDAAPEMSQLSSCCPCSGWKREPGYP